MTAKHAENERIGSLYVEIKTDEKELEELWKELETIHTRVYSFILPFPLGPGGETKYLCDWEYDDLSTTDIQNTIDRMRALDERIELKTLTLNNLLAHGK